jgi:molecular chaperone GrpE
MATKRRTEHDSPRRARKPEAVSADAAASDDAVSKAGPEVPAEATKQQPAEATKQQPAEPAEATDQQPAQTAQTAEAPEADRRVEELASQLEEANSRHLRLAADFDNYKKRARQEQLDTMRYAAATVAERLLPVLDDADLALSHVPEGVDEGWLKGVRLTFQKLKEVLASVGVERIEVVGSPFDPKQHEAVGSEETAEQPEDTVVAELRAGYRMHDRVLRPALVKVARPPA